VKKVKRFQQFFDKELPKQPTNKEAFNIANQKFKDATGINGYSSYNSFLVVIKKNR